MKELTEKLGHENVKDRNVMDRERLYTYHITGYRRQSLAEVVAESESFVVDVNQQYVYGFDDAYSIKPHKIYVQLPFPPTAVIHMLIAYLQFSAYEIFNYYAMGVEDLCELLTMFYGAKILTNDEVRVFETMASIYIIDSLENWDTHCGMFGEIMGIKAFHREGLNEILGKLVAEYQARENE